MKETTAIGKYRINSIDILRGLIMLVMALDHTRDFFHQPAVIDTPTNLATTTPAIFFTRWITHFCAPIFVFLSGISAFISGQRKSPSELSNFLIKRGLWLVVVELIIVSLGISFSPLYTLIVLQVIWAIGWSMVIIGLILKLPKSATIILISGVVLFFGRNILDFINLPTAGVSRALLRVFLTTPGDFIPLGSSRILLLSYAILPWTALMMLGYSFGKIFKQDVSFEKRKRVLLYSGVGLLALFFILRYINVYGDPLPWAHQKNESLTVISFFNVTKYPCSLLYCSMTIGTACIALVIFEKMNNGITRFFEVYGRVPFFYYILHFYLIHVFLIIAFFASGYKSDQIIPTDSPFWFRPAQFGFSLPYVYLFWLLVILTLYYPCRWFGKYKKTHSQWWLSYL